MRVGLLGCGKAKVPHEAAARDLYTGALFRKGLAYLALVGADPCYVLSAMHGLVPMDARLAPYELALHDLPLAQRREWARRVNADLAAALGKAGPPVEFVILAGKAYTEHLVPLLTPWATVAEPMAGMKLGARLSWLNQATSGEAPAPVAPATPDPAPERRKVWVPPVTLH